MSVVESCSETAKEQGERKRNKKKGGPVGHRLFLSQGVETDHQTNGILLKMVITHMHSVRERGEAVWWQTAGALDASLQPFASSLMAQQISH